jgi:hypothetical protein
MAITNAQQFKQLVNPPMDGKRPGYRGDDAARSSEGTSGGRADPGNAPRGEGPATNAPSQDRIAEIRQANITLENLKQDKIEEKLEKFRQLNSRTRQFQNFASKFSPIAMFASKFGPLNTRDFFTDKVLGSKNFADMTKEKFANLSEEDKEDMFDSYMEGRMSGATDAYGNRINTGNDGGGQQVVPIIPQTISNMTANAGDADEKENVGRMFRLLADGGMTEDAPVGGIMDIESGRQMYGLGKLVKKATRAVKKIVKSPIGKAALLYAGTFGIPGTGFKGLSGTSFFKDKFMPFMFKGGEFGLSNLTSKGAMAGIAALSAAPLLFGKQEEDDEENIDRGPPLEIDRIRANPYLFTPRRFAAEGGSMKEPVAKKTMPLIDMDGKEKDYRETGGFVDMGRMERADDVPARLSKNEFVFTADAVRNAGDGSVDKGAEVMYNMMKNLEAGGDVSEESQGLDGAREMFQTSQRLGEVL